MERQRRPNPRHGRGNPQAVLRHRGTHRQGSRETGRPAESRFDPGCRGRGERPRRRSRLRAVVKGGRQANRRTGRRQNQGRGHVRGRWHRHQMPQERPGQERGRGAEGHLPPLASGRSADRRERPRPAQAAVSSIRSDTIWAALAVTKSTRSSASRTRKNRAC